jgi:hypothetical protein
MSAVSGPGAAQHAQANVTREAVAADQRELKASLYNNTSYGYSPTTTSRAVSAAQQQAVQRRLLQQMALNRRLLRKRASASQHGGDGGVDEPSGIETHDQEVDEAASDRRDAAHQGHARRGGLYQPTRSTSAKRKRGGGDDKVERDDTEGGDEEGFDAGGEGGGEQVHQHHNSGGGGGGGSGQDDSGGGAGGHGGGGGEQGGQNRRGGTSLASPFRNASGQMLNKPASGEAAAEQRAALDVKFGPALPRELNMTGPIERMSDKLSEDDPALDDKLNEANFQQHWSLYQRALPDPDVNWGAELDALTCDWQQALLKRMALKRRALKRLSMEEVIGKIKDAQRLSGKKPKNDPDRSQRTSTMNLLLPLKIFDDHAPKTLTMRIICRQSTKSKRSIRRLVQMTVKKAA